MRPRMPSLARWFGLWGVAVVLVLVTLVVPEVAGFHVDRARAGAETLLAGRVVAVESRERQPSPRGEVEREVLLVATDGTTVRIESTRLAGDTGTLALEAGDEVLVTRVAGPDGSTYYVSDRRRPLPLAALAIGFSLCVLAIGRVTGAWSLLGLAASGLVIMRYIVPGILSGHDPVLIAITGAAAIIGVTLYLTHGADRKTAVALAGTCVSLALTALLASVAIGAAQLTGVASEEAATLQQLAEHAISPTGLLLAGVVIGALGVLDDVTIAQASAVFELRDANPALPARELYRRAMRIGHDHIAATVNTLVLAYAGAALPLLMLLAAQGEPLLLQLHREFVTIEIVRTLVGSLGIVAAVPLTTALAALTATRLGAAHGGAA
ncbi:MAG: YibE/F family protein [Chloroflexi bacterium]|nr:YibE/F family protein [Chloroflexota bacterium]